jgi:hypothetical protein
LPQRDDLAILGMAAPRPRALACAPAVPASTNGGEAGVDWDALLLPPTAPDPRGLAARLAMARALARDETGEPRRRREAQRRLLHLHAELLTIAPAAIRLLVRLAYDVNPAPPRDQARAQLIAIGVLQADDFTRLTEAVAVEQALARVVRAGGTGPDDACPQP